MSSRRSTILALLMTVPAMLVMLWLILTLMHVKMIPVEWISAAIAAAAATAGASVILVRQLAGSERQVDELSSAYEALRRRAEQDPLTGLLNRQAFERLAEPAGAGHVLLIDIDRFKAINDQHGHATGDEALRQIGRVLMAQSAPLGPVARIGGEEFALFLSCGSPADAAAFAEHLRRSIAALQLRIEGEPVQFSASIGVAARRAGEPLTQVLRRADRAMYRAKQAGRNRVEIVAELAA